ncbi:MAG TPA: hypothetical protein VE687_18685, partial [Stellaceae bacterium]|nr:hypothetical protein [Stellaceae bacterium]
MNDLAAMRPKRPQIWIDGIHDWPEILIGESDISGEVERMEVPIWVLETKYAKNPFPKYCCSAYSCERLFERSASRDAPVIQAGQLEEFDSLPAHNQG